MKGSSVDQFVSFSRKRNGVCTNVLDSLVTEAELGITEEQMAGASAKSRSPLPPGTPGGAPAFDATADGALSG